MSNKNYFLQILATVPLSIAISFTLPPFKDTSDFKSQTQAVTTQSQYPTRAEYERLEIGASLTTVEAIIGRGTEIKRSATTANFMWDYPNGSKITCTFEKGKLKDKEQFNLK